MWADAGQKPIVRALGVGLGYGVIAYLCLTFTRFGAPVESIWLPNALLVASLVASRPAAWPLIVLCAAAAHLSAHLLTSDAPAFSVGFLTGDMSESVLCAALLNLRPRALALQNRAGVFYFLAICTLSAFISAIIATIASRFTQRPLASEDFYIWFAADSLALVIFLPIFHGFGEGRWRRLRDKPLHLAAALAAIIGLSVVGAVFVHIPTLRLLHLPLLVLIAFDLGVAGIEIALAALLLALAALTYAGMPTAPWVEMDSRSYMVLAQAFIAIFAITVLPLAVVLEERQRLNETLTDCLRETRDAWGAVIGAEARYQLVVNNVSETVMRVGRDGLILFASPACAELIPVEHIEGKNLFNLLHPDDRSDARERLEQCLRLGLLNLAHRWTWRIGDPRMDWMSVDARVTLVAPGGVGHEEFIVVAAPMQTTNA